MLTKISQSMHFFTILIGFNFGKMRQRKEDMSRLVMVRRTFMQKKSRKRKKERETRKAKFFACCINFFVLNRFDVVFCIFDDW